MQSSTCSTIFFPCGSLSRRILGCLDLAGRRDCNHQWRALLIALASGAVWFAVFFAINWFRPDVLGFGDVRLVGLLGLCLGWLGVPIVFVAFFASNPIALSAGLVLIGTKRASRKTPIPFGLFLAIGAIFAIFVGPPIVNHFRGL